MKKIAIVALLSCSSFISFAQDGFYRAASFGLGRAAQNNQHPEGIYTENLPTFLPTQAWQATADLGYKLHNWRFVAGVQFLADGYDVEHLNMFSGGRYRVQARYNHLNIPVKVGYTINISKKFAIIPYAGASVGYNFNPKMIDRRDGVTRINTESDADFDYFGYHRISFRATGQVDLRYQLCSMMAITAGPTANMMLGSMQTEDANKFVTKPFRLNSYTVNIGIELTMPKGGCCWHRGCAKPAAGTTAE